jgi:hypothetical protein
MKEKVMNDNYLWDRSGEPDPKIQELEDILSTLRYQPQPLRIPQQLQIERRRSFYPAMAIAATIALAVLLLGLWLSFNRRPTPTIEASHPEQLKPGTTPIETAVKSGPGKEKLAEQTPSLAPKQKPNESYRNLLARNRSRSIPKTVREPELTPDELAQKQQVLVALRLVSVKLNVAQRRTQGVLQPNPVRNLHKIG